MSQEVPTAVPLLWDQGNPPPNADERGVAQIHLVQVNESVQCKKSGCCFAIACSNYGHCPFHLSYFAPKSHKAGGLLLGKEFMHSGDGSTKKCERLCACGKDKCRLIGYPNAGYATIPRNKEKAAEWCSALSINGKERQKFMMDGSKSSAIIAYWHFRPEHRTRGRDGKWKINDMLSSEEYRDEDRKIWRSLPPS